MRKKTLSQTDVHGAFTTFTHVHARGK